MKKESTATIVFLLSILIFIYLLNGFGYIKQLKNTVFYIASPAQEIFQSQSNKINDLIYTLNKIDNLKNENEKLKKENLNLIYKISELTEVERENKILKEQLRFSDNLCAEGICPNWKMGKVISRDPSNYERFIIINIGEKDGIKEKQAVVAQKGLLVGKIVEVFWNSSRAMLITSPDSSVNSITKTTRSSGIAVGSYATGVKLEMINQTEELIYGDLIITSGLEEKIPKGLIIGTVSKIDESANKVFKEADINLFVDLSKIEEVFVAVN